MKHQMGIFSPHKIVFLVTVLVFISACADKELQGPEVTVVNQAPVINIGIAEQTVLSETLVSLNASATDADGDELTYQWVQLILDTEPAVTLTPVGDTDAEFTAPVVSTPTTFTFEIRVSDSRNGVSSQQVSVIVHPILASALSGTIAVSSPYIVDSDVNDPAAAYSANDTLDTPQAIGSPAIVGGYVNESNVGPEGRGFATGDLRDYFAVALIGGQWINLHLGDSNGTTMLLALLLFDTNGDLVESVSGSSGSLSLQIPSTSTFIIGVSINVGASSYVLSVGDTMAAGLSANSFSTTEDFVPGEVMVQFREVPGQALTPQNRASQLGLRFKGGVTGRETLLSLNPDAALSLNALGVKNRPLGSNAQQQAKLDTVMAAAALASRSDVAWVSLNHRLQPSLTPDDPLFQYQWHYPMINLPQAWDETTGAAEVTVAVIDTGVLPNHPDLAGQFVLGYDFISDPVAAGDGDGPDADPTDVITDDGFHGTLVAGIVGAVSDNATGVSGVSWGSKIMPLRVLGQNGGTEFDMIQAVRYAAGLSNNSGTVLTADQKADVINLSLGRTETGTIVTPPSFIEARDAGVILVAAAGNGGTTDPVVPASYEGVISVSAVDINSQLAPYSSSGAYIDLTAPGASDVATDFNNDGVSDFIYSTSGRVAGINVRDSYQLAAGTSLAAPHVAAVVALMKSVYPALTPAEFDAMLSNGDLSQDIGDVGRDDSFGHGLIDAHKAVLAAAAAQAGGTPPVADPVLQVSPASLNFGMALNNMILSISNGGDGTLTGLGIVEDSGGWLSVTENTVDANGLGSYIVAVNRNSLADGNYSASISVNSDFGSASVTVNMQVSSTITQYSAGPQLIELRNVDTNEVSRQTVTQFNGAYPYTFADVMMGTYRIRSGSDLDNDGVLCELGESCGAYPLLDSTFGDIVVDGWGNAVEGLDFNTGFNIGL